MKSRAPPRHAPASKSESSSSAPAGGRGLQQARDALLRAALREPVARLPAVVRLSPRAGLDGADVKVHAGGPVVTAALDLMGAEAAVVRGEALFRDAQPADELVAHELVHIAQAEGVGRGATGSMSAPGDASEREADEEATRLLAGEDAEVSQAASEAQGSFFSDLQQSARELISNTVSSAVNKVADVLGIGDQAVATTSQADDITSDSTAAIPTVYYANGMNTPLEASSQGGETGGASPDAAALESALGHEVQLNYNPTSGFLGDLVECGAEKFLGYNGAGVDNAASEYLDAIEAGETVPIVAHSQGAIETARAMEVVRSELAASAMEEGMDAKTALAWAEAEINERVEILLVGPGQAAEAFPSFLDDSNIQSLTDPRDWVSEAATMTSRQDAYDAQLDLGLSVPSGAFEPHSFTNYLENYPEVFEDWFEAVKNEHDPTKIDMIETPPRFA